MVGFLASPGGAALISGAASALDSIFGSSPEPAEGVDKAFTREMFRRQRDAARNAERRDWKRQKKVLRQGTGWQMQDIFDTADENGIHRLAALGVQGAGYQPVGQAPGGVQMAEGGGGTPGSDPFLGDAVSRALNAALAQREFEHDKKMDEAELELLKAQAKTIEANTRQKDSETRLSDKLGATTKNIDQVATDGEGNSITYPVGPDLGELISGSVGKIMLGIKQIPKAIREQTKWRRKFDAELAKKRGLSKKEKADLEKAWNSNISP